MSSGTSTTWGTLKFCGTSTTYTNLDCVSIHQEYTFLQWFLDLDYVAQIGKNRVFDLTCFESDSEEESSVVSQDSDGLVDHLVSELGIPKEDVLVAHSTDSAHLKEGHCPGALTNNCMFLHVLIFFFSCLTGICLEQ